MNQNEIINEIKQLAEQRDALILAHNYQRDEIQELAHITGDSLALSMDAARTDKQVIVFCGVHFMAESAAILAPEKTVLLPRLDAGCPMADMVTTRPLPSFPRRLDAGIFRFSKESSPVLHPLNPTLCSSWVALNPSIPFSTIKAEKLLGSSSSFARITRTLEIWELVIKHLRPLTI